MSDDVMGPTHAEDLELMAQLPVWQCVRLYFMGVSGWIAPWAVFAAGFPAAVISGRMRWSQELSVGDDGITAVAIVGGALMMLFALALRPMLDQGGYKIAGRRLCSLGMCLWAAFVLGGPLAKVPLDKDKSHVDAAYRADQAKARSVAGPLDLAGPQSMLGEEVWENGQVAKLIDSQERMDALTHEARYRGAPEPDAEATRRVIAKQAVKERLGEGLILMLQVCMAEAFLGVAATLLARAVKRTIQGAAAVWSAGLLSWGMRGVKGGAGAVGASAWGLWRGLGSAGHAIKGGAVRSGRSDPAVRAEFERRALEAAAAKGHPNGQGGPRL